MKITDSDEDNMYFFMYHEEESEIEKRVREI